MKKLLAFALAGMVLVLIATAGFGALNKKASGVLVCVPVTGSATPEPFWLGYREYIYFYVAGLPQLPANPSGMITNRALHDRGLKNGLAIAGPTAVEVARVLGLDYALCVTVKTASGRHTLSLQLWDASTGKAAGAPMIVSGSQAELAKRLKPLLFAIVDRLGIALSPAQKKAYEEIEPPTREKIIAVGDVLSAKCDASAVERLKQLSSKDPVVAVQQTDVAGKDEAVRIAQEIAGRYPEFISPQVLLGTYLANAGKFSEADAAIDEGLRRYPDNFRLLFTRYRLRCRQKDLGRQMRIAEQIARLYPKAAVSWALVSETAADQASDIREGRYWAKLSAAEQNRVTDLYRRVIYAGKKAIYHDPRYVYMWTKLQWHYMAMSQDVESEQAFEKAVSIDPGNSRAYGNAIQNLEGKWSDDPQRVRKQKTIVARVMKSTLHDGDWDGRRWLIGRLIENHFNREAVIHLEAALKQFGEPCQDAHELLARAYSKLGNRQSAEKEAVLAIRQAKSQGETDQFGEQAFDLFWDKAYDLARMYFDEALIHCPRCAGDYCLVLAICHWEMGQHDKAVEDWKRVLSVSGREHDLAAQFGLAVAAFTAGDAEKGKAEGLRLVHIEHRLVDPKFIDDGLRWRDTLKQDAGKLIDALIQDGLSLPDMGIPGR